MSFFGKNNQQYSSMSQVGSQMSAVDANTATMITSGSLISNATANISNATANINGAIPVQKFGIFNVDPYEPGIDASILAMEDYKVLTDILEMSGFTVKSIATNIETGHAVIFTVKMNGDISQLPHQMCKMLHKINHQYIPSTGLHEIEFELYKRSIDIEALYKEVCEQHINKEVQKAINE